MKIDEAKVTRLHQKQFEVITELYQQLSVLSLMFPALPQFDEAEIEQFNMKAHSAHWYFHQHEVYFGEDLCEVIEDCMCSFVNADFFKTHLKSDFSRIFKALQGELDTALLKVEEEFRRLLGVATSVG